MVTENFLKYIKEELLVFKVFGFPDVQKEKAGAPGEGGDSVTKKKGQLKAAAQATMGK